MRIEESEEKEEIKMVTKKKFKGSVSVSRALFAGGLLGLAIAGIPYMVFWALKALQLVWIDYTAETWLAFWILAVFIPFSLVPRKVKLV